MNVTFNRSTILQNESINVTTSSSVGNIEILNILVLAKTHLQSLHSWSTEWKAFDLAVHLHLFNQMSRHSIRWNSA